MRPEFLLGARWRGEVSKKSRPSLFFSWLARPPDVGSLRLALILTCAPQNPPRTQDPFLSVWLPTPQPPAPSAGARAPRGLQGWAVGPGAAEEPAPCETARFLGAGPAPLPLRSGAHRPAPPRLADRGPSPSPCPDGARGEGDPAALAWLGSLLHSHPTHTPHIPVN